MVPQQKIIGAEAVKMQTATAMAQTLAFSFERKYLQNIGDSTLNPIFRIQETGSTLKGKPIWIKITQVGKPLGDKTEDCFTAIQKILLSCFLPKQTQLLFLIINDGASNNMYLGLRLLNTRKLNSKFVVQLAEFMKAQWPGLKCDVLNKEERDALDVFAKERICEKSTRNSNHAAISNVFALTGIPSMEGQYKNLYPATIDRLMAGMNGAKDFVYLVVADPIETPEIDSMLYQCREMNGQAESLKSFNISEGRTAGITRSITEGTNWSHTDGTNTSHSGKDWSGAWNKIKGSVGTGAILGGVAVAACAAFPPAAAAMSAIASGINASAAVSAGSALLGMMDSKTTGENHSDTQGGSASTTQGMSESQSQTVSHNVINKHIEAMSEHLFYHSKRLETGKAIGMWKVGTYLLTSDDDVAVAGTLQLRSILSGQESIFEPIRITNLTDGDIIGASPDKCFKIDNSFGRIQAPNLYIQTLDNENFQHPLGDQYKELKTVLTTKELSYLINFPLRSVPGISVIDSSPEFSLNVQKTTDKETIDFGKLLYGGTPVEIPYSLTIPDLAKHTLLSGINGSGKTNTVLSILNSLAGKMPFLIIEPAKTEYVDWAAEYNRNHPENPITIYMPGVKTYRDKKTRQDVPLAKLKLNPFEPVWLEKGQDPNILSHIDRLKSTFAAAFPMYDILPVLMEDLVYSIYQNKSTDWLTTEPEFGKTMPPTLNSMSVGVDKVISNRQYEARIEQNMKACLNTRIDSLKRGWKGEMLNTVHSTPWAELFEKPVVINLSYVGDDVDKSFFMSLILQLLYEYRNACAELGRIDFNDNGCSHLTVIEEAHRVMMKCDKPDMPQYKTAMMFSNMLSEIRAYGEGMFLVDQVPTRLIPDAIKNTNTKITHRLVAEDDVKAVAEAMGLSKEQRPIIPKLMVGQCIVSTSLTPDKHWVQVNKSK